MSKLVQREPSIDSPGSDNDSDAEYDSLKGVLGNVQLGKYFSKFRQREVRMAELKLLNEEDLKEASEYLKNYGDNSVGSRKKNVWLCRPMCRPRPLRIKSLQRFLKTIVFMRGCSYRFFLELMSLISPSKHAFLYCFGSTAVCSCIPLFLKSSLGDSSH